ncbi:MAG TPA: hypothetical protein VMH81_11940 [Bryobacteraceae bacterium]|nr:hypothetical protein [Bryobacteraceae bacterium]
MSPQKKWSLEAGFGLRVLSPLYLEQRHTSLEEEKKEHPDFELGQYEFTFDREERTAEEKRSKQFKTWKDNGLDWSTAGGPGWEAAISTTKG